MVIAEWVRGLHSIAYNCPVGCLDEVETDLAGQLQWPDELPYPGFDLGFVHHLVVDLEGRGFTTAVRLHPAVADGAVRAVFLAVDQCLHDPRGVPGDRLGPDERGGLLRCGLRQGGQVEPIDRVVRDALEDVGIVGAVGSRNPRPERRWRCDGRPAPEDPKRWPAWRTRTCHQACEPGPDRSARLRSTGTARLARAS